MPSQIKVDEIKNVAGQYKIKTNVFEGQTTAGSIAVQGEGTATTNLQQGLSKHWISVNMSTAAVNDSFNAGSLTDNGTGDFTNTLTNLTTNAHYANTQGSLYVQAWGQISFFRGTRTTSSYRTGSVNYHNNGNATDSTQFDTSIDGDLA